MLNDEEYTRLSMENNLFWTRIMREHAVFIESSMPPPQRQLAMQANRFKRQFDRLLSESIRLATGSVSDRSLQSGQYFTKATEAAEQATQQFTGTAINSNLTKMEYHIQPAGSSPQALQRTQEVSRLNQSALDLVNTFARFKSELYNRQTSCKMFTFLYASIYEHVFHEAKKYLEILTGLQKKDENYNGDYQSFWNQHMADHAKVMRGLFDPTETEHFNAADSFAKTFDTLVRSRSAAKEEELEATKALSGFKSDTTREIIECRVKSLMSPLFTDHITREANYYIYLLQS